MSKIKSELQDIVAEVYAGNVELEWCYVKITFVGLGMYINSFKVTRSKKSGELVVYPPSHFHKARGLTSTVEFDKSQLQLWFLIERIAVQAYFSWIENDGDFNESIAIGSKYAELYERTETSF